MERPHESLELYGHCRALDWAHLPLPGGIADQPAWFLRDAGTLARRMAFLEERKKRISKWRDKVKDRWQAKQK